MWPSADGLLEDLDRCLWHQEEPFPTASIYAQWKVMELAKRHDVTVLLDGQGADETLAGYPAYFTPYHAELLAQRRLGDPESAAPTVPRAICRARRLPCAMIAATRSFLPVFDPACAGDARVVERCSLDLDSGLVPAGVLRRSAQRKGAMDRAFREPARVAR